MKPGDVVLILTGRMNLWPDMAFMKNTPGLNREGVEYLAKHGAILIGADNGSVEQTRSPSELNFFPVHTYLLAEAGVPMPEMARLEEIAAEKLYEFAFFGACIKLRGATKAPMSLVVMPLVGVAKFHLRDDRPTFALVTQRRPATRPWGNRLGLPVRLRGSSHNRNVEPRTLPC